MKPKRSQALTDAIAATHCVASWTPKIRFLASLLIVIHLLAVLAEPFRFFSRSPEKFAAEDALAIRSTLGRYVDMMYLSHGYFFFAPNPGPSHLLDCQFHEREGGKNSRRLRYPDRKDQWPRLLYHRHFMLTEFYHSLFAPTKLENEEGLDPRTIQQWKEDRERYESLQESIRKNVLSKYPGDEVHLKRIQHELPIPRLILGERWRLTDPRLYNELLEGPMPNDEQSTEAKPEAPPPSTSVPLRPAETPLEFIVPPVREDTKATNEVFKLVD